MQPLKQEAKLNCSAVESTAGTWTSHGSGPKERHSGSVIQETLMTRARFRVSVLKTTQVLQRFILNSITELDYLEKGALKENFPDIGEAYVTRLRWNSIPSDASGTYICRDKGNDDLPPATFFLPVNSICDKVLFYLEV